MVFSKAEGPFNSGYLRGVWQCCFSFHILATMDHVIHPFLESPVPQFTSLLSPPSSPHRWVFLYSPHGALLGQSTWHLYAYSSVCLWKLSGWSHPTVWALVYTLHMHLKSLWIDPILCRAKALGTSLHDGALQSIPSISLFHGKNLPVLLRM